MPICLILIGPPGGGKGTQAELLQERLHLKHISTGDLFRAEIAKGTDLGLEAQRHIKSGNLVPDEITIQMVRGQLDSDDARSYGFILDGFPRTKRQAIALDKVLKGIDMRLNAVIALEIPEQVVIDRLLARGRQDDMSETIIHRLDVFARQTEPVIRHYSDLGCFHTVDADKPVEDVYAGILKAITG